jgi:hypothetical protein
MSAENKKPGDSKVTIKIPRNLYNRLAKIVEGSGFNSVTDFIVYILRDLASSGYAAKTTEKPAEPDLSKEEIEAIRKRLHSLGYF